MPGSNEQVVVLAQNQSGLQIYKVRDSLTLWHSVNLTDNEMQSLSFANGQILYQKSNKLVSLTFCSDHQYYSNGLCIACPSKQATTSFQ